MTLQAKTKRKIPTTLYTLKPSAAGAVMVSKLDKDFGPTEIYTISENKTGSGDDLVCTCPSRFFPCKHVKLLKHAQKAYEADYSQRYWHVAPHAKWIESFTAEEVGIEV